MQLDHVALADHTVHAALDVLVGELGGTVLQGAELTGYRTVQVHVGDATRGMTVELVEPFHPERDDFVERFLEHRGPGPHHLTFKVDDLEREIARARDFGIEPIGVFLASEHWKEAFLPPKLAHGTVVQLAQGGLDYPTFADKFRHMREAGPWGQPRWWPDPPARAADTAVLDRAVLSTPVLDDAAAFFTELLEGAVASRSATTVDVVWEHGACVRLEHDRDRPPGIVRLEVRAAGPPRELGLAGTRVVITPA